MHEPEIGAGRVGALRAYRARAAACAAATLSLWLSVSITAPGVAHADPDRREYIARLDLVMDGLKRTLSWVERHRNRASTARFAHPLAEQWVDLVGRMTPPRDMVIVHPHLLLIAEHLERAVDAAGSDDLSTFRQHVRTIRIELRTLDTILTQLEVRLPSANR